MADDQALRARRSRAHKLDDHSLCKPERCEGARFGLRGLPDELDLVPPGSMVETYRSTLSDAGRLGTPEGAHVMLLVGLLETGKHTAAGAAALSRELRASMVEALKGAPRKADAVDELAARRDRKVAGA